MAQEAEAPKKKVGSVTQAKSEDAFKKLVKNSKAQPLFVDFFAEWCGPCKKIAPAIEVISGENPDITFIKVDVDELEDVSEEYGIEAMPTFIIIYDGKVWGEPVQGANEEAIKDLINKFKAEKK